MHTLWGSLNNFNFLSKHKTACLSLFVYELNSALIFCWDDDDVYDDDDDDEKFIHSDLIRF